MKISYTYYKIRRGIHFFLKNQERLQIQIIPLRNWSNIQWIVLWTRLCCHWREHKWQYSCNTNICLVCFCKKKVWQMKSLQYLKRESYMAWFDLFYNFLSHNNISWIHYNVVKDRTRQTGIIKIFMNMVILWNNLKKNITHGNKYD